MTARRVATLVLFDLVASLVVVGLVSLAAWQVQRRAGKLDLIARIEARVHAAPVEAPGQERWAEISAPRDEYRRINVTGEWLTDSRPALVQAATDLGGGSWVLMPLRRDDGTIVLVNRGFVPADKRDPGSWRPLPDGITTVTGLLRMSEPGGCFLRSNDPGADRWFSRDVAAIAASRGLGAVAPFFVDAERSAQEAGFPVAGLTVLRFSNNHLVYAITWAALALMAAAGAVAVHLDLIRAGRRSFDEPAR